MMFKRNQKGFSLVELMIVVAIIGVLAALAVPKFSQFQAKARQAEAKNNLSHLFTLETAYHGDNDTYAAIAMPYVLGAANVIGFNIPAAAKTRYQYGVAAGGAGITASFIATAQARGAGTANMVFPGCATIDAWTMDQDKVMANSVNAGATCR